MRRCLEKHPGERFQSARDLGFALNEAISGPASAVLPVVSGGSRRWLGMSLGLAALVLAALVASNLGGVRDRFRSSPAAGPIQSLAVLPATNISGDPEQEFFADGMTEELIIGLKQIGSLHVISRTSVMTYKGTKKTLPQIGRELGVQGILESSVARAGDRVRIRVQLTEAATERHVWAKSYEHDLRNILSLQSEVAQAVADEIRAAVTPAERVRLAKKDEVDPQVHELYLRGKFHLSKGTEEELEKAIGFFEQALGKNAAYAPAYAGLAGAYYGLSDVYRPPLDVLPKSKAAAIKALEIDERLAGAHVALGGVHLFFDWDWTAAEKAFKRALEIDPGNAAAHDFYGTLLAGVLGRRDEGIAHTRVARQLDPLSLLVQFDSGWAHFMARQYDEAIAAYRKAIALEPMYGWAHGALALSYAALGRKAEAVAAADEGRRVDQSPLVLALAGGVYAQVGEVARAREVVARLNELTAANRYVCAYEVALIHVGLGEPNDAFRWFEKGYRDRSSCMPFVKLDPRLDPVRPDPRYGDLVRRVGFPP